MQRKKDRIIFNHCVFYRISILPSFLIKMSCRRHCQYCICKQLVWWCFRGETQYLFFFLRQKDFCTFKKLMQIISAQCQNRGEDSCLFMLIICYLSYQFYLFYLCKVFNHREPQYEPFFYSLCHKVICLNSMQSHVPRWRSSVQFYSSRVINVL